MYIELPVSPSRRTTSPFFTSRSRNMSARRSKTGVPASPPKNGVLARNSLRAASAMRPSYACAAGAVRWRRPGGQTNCTTESTELTELVLKQPNSVSSVCSVVQSLGRGRGREFLPHRPTRPARPAGARPPLMPHLSRCSAVQARACLTARGPSPSLRMRWIEAGRNGKQDPTADRGATGRVLHRRLPATDRREGADQPPFALSRGARGAGRGQAVRDHRPVRRLPAGVRARAVDGLHPEGGRALPVRSLGAPAGAQLRRARAGVPGRQGGPDPHPAAAARARRSRRRGHLGGHGGAHRDLVAHALAGDAEGGARTRGPGAARGAPPPASLGDDDE